MSHIILKTLSAPATSDFDELVAEARRQARKADLKRSDVATATARKLDRRKSRDFH